MTGGWLVHDATSFERIAVVSDASWVGPAMRVFSVLLPGQARAFPLAQREVAAQWAATGGMPGSTEDGAR